MQLNRKNLDVFIIVSAMALAVIGILFCLSALSFRETGLLIVRKQMIFFAAGLVLMLLFSNIDYHLYRQIAPAIYIAGFFLLVSVLFLGKIQRGQKGWFDLGFFSLQPAEIAKIIFIIGIAGIIDGIKKPVQRLSSIILPVLLGLAYTLIIIIQPDFGGSVIYMPLTLTLLFLGGAELMHLSVFIFWSGLSFGLPLYKTYISLNRYVWGSVVWPEPWIIIIGIIILVLVLYFYLNRRGVFIPGEWLVFIYLVIVTATFSGYFMQKFLKGYQKQRLIMFIDPKKDALGAGYNVIQSKIAVGSGAVFGRGFMSGTQGKLGFLPERHTDFIFSVISEEMGFFFVVFVLGLYFVLLFRIYRIARNARDRFGSLVASGFFFMFGFFVIFNIGMSIGILPITGVTLPFVSYGGSSLISYMIALGIVMNIGREQ